MTTLYLTGWDEIESYKSPKIGGRLCRNSVKSLARLGFLPILRTPERRVKVLVRDLEKGWADREEARDLLAWEGGRGRGNPSDRRAAEVFGRKYPDSEVAARLKKGGGDE